MPTFIWVNIWLEVPQKMRNYSLSCHQFRFYVKSIVVYWKHQLMNFRNTFFFTDPPPKTLIFWNSKVQYIWNTVSSIFVTFQVWPGQKWINLSPTPLWNFVLSIRCTFWKIDSLNKDLPQCYIHSPCLFERKTVLTLKLEALYQSTLWIHKKKFQNWENCYD